MDNQAKSVMQTTDKNTFNKLKEDDEQCLSRTGLKAIGTRNPLPLLSTSSSSPRCSPDQQQSTATKLIPKQAGKIGRPIKRKRGRKPTGKNAATVETNKVSGLQDVAGKNHMNNFSNISATSISPTYADVLKLSLSPKTCKGESTANQNLTSELKNLNDESKTVCRRLTRSMSLKNDNLKKSTPRKRNFKTVSVDSTFDTITAKKARQSEWTLVLSAKQKRSNKKCSKQVSAVCRMKSMNNTLIKNVSTKKSVLKIENIEYSTVHNQDDGKSEKPEMPNKCVTLETDCFMFEDISLSPTYTEILKKNKFFSLVDEHESAILSPTHHDNESDKSTKIAGSLECISNKLNRKSLINNGKPSHLSPNKQVCKRVTRSMSLKTEAASATIPAKRNLRTLSDALPAKKLRNMTKNNDQTSNLSQNELQVCRRVTRSMSLKTETVSTKIPAKRNLRTLSDQKQIKQGNATCIINASPIKVSTRYPENIKSSPTYENKTESTTIQTFVPHEVEIKDCFSDYIPGCGMPPALPEQAVLASLLMPECISTGTKHQGKEYYPASKNLSCVVMASTAICCKHINNNEFDSQQIDKILDDGNQTYFNHVLGKVRLLEPEELPSNLQCDGHKFAVSSPVWVDSGLYPRSSLEIDDLVKILHRAFKIHAGAQGFLFTGLINTVSFWLKLKQENNNSNFSIKNDLGLLINVDYYLLFNSHGVETSGICSKIDTSLNKARLFKLYNLKSLARLLLLNGWENVIQCGNPNNEQYSIHAVYIKSYEKMTTLTASLDTSNNHIEGRKNICELSYNKQNTTFNGSNEKNVNTVTGHDLKQKTKISITDNIIVLPSHKTNTTNLRKPISAILQRSEKLPTKTIDTSLQADYFSGYYPGSSISPPLPQRSVLASSIEIECVATGSKHQGEKYYPHSKNSSCVVMSSTAICHKHAHNLTFNTQVIDKILDDADRIYFDHVNGNPDLLEPENLPSHLQCDGISFRVSSPEWIDSGLYPRHELNTDDLVRKLHRAFTIHKDAQGFLFTGLDATVSIWMKKKHDGLNYTFSSKHDRGLLIDIEHYLLFNSHAINVSGIYSTVDESANKARLFKMYNLKSLAHFLLLNGWENVIKYGNTSNKQFSIYAVYVESFEEIPTILSTSTSNTSISTNSNKSKIGRPKKTKRGCRKTKQNSHLDAVMKYKVANPDVNLKAVKKYTAANPQVHRDSVQKYAATNPQISRESSQRHRDQNIDQVRQANITQNRLRDVEPHLRYTSLIGEKSGDSLQDISLYTFEVTSLKNESAVICAFCRARLFKEEKGAIMFCCGQGKYNIVNLQNINTEAFYSNPIFLKRIRAYNNLFAFSALGVSHGFQQPNTGVAFLKIQGRTYHRVFDLSYTASNNPIAMYINDNDERSRLAQQQSLNPDIVRQITSFLESVNPFIGHFRRLSLEPSDEAHIIFEKTSRSTHGNILGDMPRGSEVAAIISTERDQYNPKTIAVWKVGERRPHTVDIFHPLYEAFQYPLLYPHGGAGWTINTLDNQSRKLSQVKYYRYFLLAIDRFTYLGRLSEEWLVDMYCRTEEERLQFISKMQQRQSNLRLAPLEEIVRDETIQGDDGNPLPGKIYLPNTFTGSPRFMKTKYMDAIAIVNRLGKPTYFLTMTCNPKWKEIIVNTPPHLNPPAAICARVFKIKLYKLLQNLRNGNWFGKSTYIMHVIEFQKRGLPHAHIVFRVEGGGPMQTLDIDRVVRADIPSEQEGDGRLRTLVLNHMIHGPCGPNHRTDLICWNSDKNRCMKHFPKRATDVTYIDDRGFIHLKRNEQNVAVISYRGADVPVNDLYVVPYNAALLLKYDCHINLEIASTRKIVKYLFKYIHKGPDEARVAIVPEELLNNEVEIYATRRYIGACEAAWRMFEFDTHGREPTVMQLAVHLENQNIVLFRRGEESQALSTAKSDLIIYFNRPEGMDFDNITYQEFYEKFIVHSSRPTTQYVPIHQITVSGKDYYITKRQRGEKVARLFWVAPNRGEQFYLRMLLASFPCRSYAELKALGGQNCDTFQSAARALGIANDEQEYATCLQEASTFYSGKKLRGFFVLLITNGAPASILWNDFMNLLSEDFLERFPNNESQAYTKSLLEIDRLLRRHGTRLADHGLPSAEDESNEYTRELSEYDHGRLRTFYEHWLPMLSPEQNIVFNYVTDLLNNTAADDASTAIFLDGPSGTGKTLLLNCIVSYVRGHLKKVAICTASSGIAALNYENGCTAHSMFKLPIDIIDDSAYWNLTNGTQRAELLHKSALIIFDEAPMTHKYLIHILDRSFKDLMNSTKPFGGKIIIFAGDFRQIPPVVPNARCKNDILSASLKTSPLYQSMTKFSLTSAQRTKEDENYSEFLLNLGNGLLQTESCASDSNAHSLISLSDIEIVSDLADLIDFVFPNEILNDPDTCANSAILSTHLLNVHEINSNILERVDGDVVHCYSVDNVDTEQADQFYLGTDVLNNIHAKGIPDYDLALKVGCVVMVIRNLSFTDRLVNGTKVVVVNISPRLITVRKPRETETFLIPRITFKFPIEPRSPIEMCRKQFPLQLSYAMTIHKSQGQTIEKVGVDLRSDVFSHGQLYVALGRVRSRNNIKILIHKQRMINNKPYAHNVIIPELIN